MIPLLLIAGAAALLPVLRGALDYLVFFRLLKGETSNPRWAARPLLFGKWRPYHAALGAFDVASLYLLWVFAPALFVPYAVAMAFAVPDALWYHCWKGVRYIDRLGESRLPASGRPHPKSVVYPLQQPLFRLFAGRTISEGEYRAAAVVAYALAILSVGAL